MALKIKVFGILPTMTKMIAWHRVKSFQMKCVKEYSNIEGETETETRNNNHCRKLYSGRSCTIHCNCTWRKKKTQIHSKYCHCTNAVLVDLVTHLLKKSLMEDFIFFCSVFSVKIGSHTFVLYLLIWV